MLATIGYIVPEYFKWPGYLSPSMDLKFEDVPNGLAAFSKLPVQGGAQIVAFTGFIETTGFFSGEAKNIGLQRCATQAGEPGNYGVGFPTFFGKVADPEVRKRKLSAEIANGRLAMMAIIGMFFQDGLTGSAWGDWALYDASPLRAFENELGVQAPVGFWDPLGLSKSGDEATFKRRRAVEIKHGRVCMLATIGYIVPEYFKWPGYLSPSMEIKFEDVPNGLAAFSKLPVQGGAQIVAFAGFIETTGFFSGEAKNIGLQRCATQAGEPGNYGVGFPTFFGKVADPEVRKRKLSAEIANGRLAMMAIIGMFFQDGLTGSAWGDWALYDASPLRFFGGGDSTPSYKVFDPATELGVQEPLGFWDPLGFTSDGD